MKAMSFSKKLWIPSILALICMALLSAYGVWQQRELRIAERRTDLSNIVDAAMSIVQDYKEMADKGLLTSDQARTQALQRLKNFRYGQEGYLTVTDSHAVVVMHPFLQEMTGKNLSDFKDGHGVHVFQEVANIGLSGKAGFVRYSYPRPGASVEEPKLMRVGHFAPWDWNISSGVYVDDIEREFRSALLQGLAILAALSGVLFALVIVINRKLLSALGGDPAYAAAIANRIASGDLSVSVDTRSGDESSMLYSMKQMQSMLAVTVSAIRTGSDTIASATDEIASGNLDLSGRTEEQASSLEQTAASMEQLTVAVRQTSDNAGQANQYAAAAADVARKGGEVVSRVIDTMTAIDASAIKISDIIGVIDGLAFQTNILALNAAVEAARAGEEGRGFAVVATEVRNLAHRSAAAAKQIKDLINHSSIQVQAGSALVRDAGSTMGEIVDSIANVRRKMQEIAEATAEQSMGIEQVNVAVGHMDQVTQQNAALVEEAAAAAASLQEQAVQLSRAVAVFQLSGAVRTVDHRSRRDVNVSRKKPVLSMGFTAAY